MRTKKKDSNVKLRSSSGRIIASHAIGSGSIPGRSIFYFNKLGNFKKKSIFNLIKKYIRRGIGFGGEQLIP